MYHYGRLLDKFPLDSLKSLAPQLREDARKLMETTPNSMDRVVLGTTLIRLGDTTGEQTLSGTMTADWAERQRYKFYIANISSLFPHWIRRMFLHSPLCIYRFYCPAYNDTLLLEYLVLSNNKRYNN
jgi:hypothetical protein